MNLHDVVAGMISRVKIVQSAFSGRTLVQVQGLDEDTHDQVELLLPPGIVAQPVPGGDALELHIGGAAGHKVIICGDNTADAQQDLAPGDQGIARTTQRILFRNGHIEITTPLLQWNTAAGGALERLVQEQFVMLFNTHTHAHGAPPDQQMNHTHLTGGS